MIREVVDIIAQGDVASVDNGGTPGVPDVVLASGYDPAGNRSSLSATIGGTKDFLNSYSYDTLSRLMAMQQVDQSGGNVVASKEVDYSYDEIGDVTRRSAYNFVGVGPRYDIATSAISYNTLGQLTGISMTSDAGQVPLDNLSYSYDTLGRVSTFGSSDGTAAYGYDKTSQLTSASYVAASGHVEPPNFSVTFDPNGNRTSTNSVSTTVGKDNHLTSDGTFNFTYDSAGNLIERVRQDTSPPTNDYKTDYDWDYRNRLTDVYFYSTSGTLTQHVHYVYDVWNNLIERDLDPNGSGTYTQIVHYVWDSPGSVGNALRGVPGAGGIVLAFNGSDQLIARYLSGPNTNAYDQYYSTLVEEDVTSTSQGGTLTFPQLDPQGSVVDIADNNGNLADHIVYFSTGGVFSESHPSVPHIAGFQGGYIDVVTGMQKFGARWEYMADAFWASQDPDGFDAGDANLSRSLGNDPTNEIDPSGLEHLPSDSRGKWVQGQRGNGVFEYADTPQNRQAGLAGERVRFRGNCIAHGGFPAKFYYGGSAKAATVPISKVTGTDADFTAADRAMRTKLGDPAWNRPAGYTWNHAGKPGSTRMELVARGPHAAVAHSGSASVPRARLRAVRVGGVVAPAFAAGTVYMGFRDACKMAGATVPEYEAEDAPYYFIDDDGSVFTVRRPGFFASFFVSPYKNFVAGPRQGQTETLTSAQARDYQEQAEAKYGKYIPGSIFIEPRFIPGTDRKTLPVTNESGYEIGYVDENGVHITNPEMRDAV